MIGLVREREREEIKMYHGFPRGQRNLSNHREGERERERRERNRERKVH